MDYEVDLIKKLKRSGFFERIIQTHQLIRGRKVGDRLVEQRYRREHKDYYRNHHYVETVRKNNLLK